MRCACCGKPVAMPDWCVTTAPRTSAALCGGCGKRWVESKDAALHNQLVALKQWPAAASQFENFKAVQFRRAA